MDKEQIIVASLMVENELLKEDIKRLEEDIKCLEDMVRKLQFYGHI